jgi:hypothetical protein
LFLNFWLFFGSQFLAYLGGIHKAVNRGVAGWLDFSIRMLMSASDPQQTLPYYWLLNETVEQFGEIRLVVLYENLLRHFPLWRRNHVLIAIHFVKLIRYQYCG